MKHFTGLAHIALFTKDLKTSTAFYEALGRRCHRPCGCGKADRHQPHHHGADARLFLEIIEPHDGSPVTAEGGLFPHIAIEVDDIDAAFADVKAAGVSSFRTEEPMTMPIFGGIRNLFFKGPDGELIELLQHL